MWTMALAIQNVSHQLEMQHGNRTDTLEDFRYRDETWGRRFLAALNYTDFEGVTVGGGAYFGRWGRGWNKDGNVKG